MDFKKIKFAGNLVPLVLSGEKTSTWRLFDDKDLSVGDKIIFINRDNGDEFARAEIKGIKEKKLGEIKEDDYKGHEKFLNKEKMIETYKDYYGDKVNEECVVKIIRFTLLNED